MEPERIGLLFVHGIGEQKRFEHLRSSVREMAELLKRVCSDARVSVVDRTEGYKPGPDTPSLADEAPITINLVTSDGNARRFDCHEVWWADLGCGKSLLDQVRFWTWGLGQWAAPIFRETDPARMADVSKASPRPRVILPRSAAGEPRIELWVRLRLAWAALAAIFSFFSWSILKRASGALFKAAPDPDLIVQYIGDVRTYERRASPNASLVSDPGHPVRVAIRRRMVTQMVAMAARKPDGWFVIAHSLGTVVAYNGLTELGHTLPNYLPESLWAELRPHAELRDGAGVERRAELGEMMPARPPWLADGDVINRTKLFAKLEGMLTYGSPLDKFAAMWPRIVATADDRADGGSVFGDTPWLNLAAPHDPVAGTLDSYSGDKGGTSGAELANVLPKLTNWLAPPDMWLGVSHIRYFINDERFRQSGALKQREAIAKWIFCGEALPSNGSVSVAAAARVAIISGYLGVTIVLGLVAIGVISAAGGVLKALFTGSAPDWPDSAAEFFAKAFQISGAVVGVALALVCAAGLLRSWRESLLNRQLGDYDAEMAPHDEHKQAAKRYLRDLSALATASAIVGLTLLALGFAIQFVADCPWLHRLACALGWWSRWIVAIVAIAVLVLSAALQSISSAPKPPR